MKPLRFDRHKSPLKLTILFFALVYLFGTVAKAQINAPLQYTVSMPQPESQYFQLELLCKGWPLDTIVFKMPKWMPGYYQILDYAQYVENLAASDLRGKPVQLVQKNENTWLLVQNRNKAFKLTYRVKADKKFVAHSFLDNSRAYMAPTGLFFYIDGFLETPVEVKIASAPNWEQIATGLEPVPGKINTFFAPNFDILYDSPILAGQLEELPPFEIAGTKHRFIGYKLGDFDRKTFMENLKKIVEASTSIIGDIPYKQYTFIAIGPGRGGIEHLNNTTVSFDGSSLNTDKGMKRMMSFLAHEYFHHYNVKRIRPFELGPFDYDRENRTNLLWISEGLTVYYEYLIMRRAGLIDDLEFLAMFEKDIEAIENNPGRFHQSLAQASYSTWSDGPFGKQGPDANKSISYYQKGPLVGLVLDLAIRHATTNLKSLDDVMRYLYQHYYKKLGRGFTDAEFQQACETIANTSLSPVFEYVYTTKEIDYNRYLAYAGLRLETQTDPKTGAKSFKIKRIDSMDAMQGMILRSLLD
jgi:predicted metalloprotease with PDZ domain